jgi:small-conductance mechanosensitive channel
MNNTLLSLALFICLLILLKIIKKIFNQRGKIKEVGQKRLFYVTKTVQILAIVFALIVLGMIWSVSWSGMLLFASSAFAVIGIALFAQWSILSNITSSIIIFLNLPTRVDDTVKILDGENTVVGKIKEITLFQVELETKNGDRVYYPNNFFMQRPIIKLKKGLEADE